LGKSWDGNENTGKNPCDRGRRGIKGTIVCDADRFVYVYSVSPANRAENTCLRNLLNHGKLDFGRKL
jgi:hypothetical protein